MAAGPLAAIVLLACGGAEGPQGATVVRDSAGIRIVENGSTARLPVLRLGAGDLRLDLGSAADDTTQLLYGVEGAYALRRFTLEGRLERIVRWQGAALAVTDAHIARLEALERGEARRLGNVATTERALAEAAYPDSAPAYQRFLMALTGELWVQDYQPPGDSVQGWTVINPDGVALRRVEMPPGLYAFEIGPDYVVGRARDALDVEHVRVYRLGL